MPECLFEVDLSAYDAGERISREASWLPSVVQRHDPSGWFEELDQWNPAYAPAPRRHSAGRHFVVVGDDAYFEILASTYTFEKVPERVANK